MELYCLEHIEDKGLYRNVELKRIGYFSSLEKAESTIRYFKTLNGFCNSPNGFIIRQVLFQDVTAMEYVYELEQQIHDTDYYYWYEKTLGIYASLSECEEAEKRFLLLNENSFSRFELISELFINCLKVDEYSSFWGEGFDTCVGGK
ncbi:MAG: hypothetical protein IKD31_03195 [Clostridia bacterium]|nr:hypothetical protein [Clostridia bacterium]